MKRGAGLETTLQLVHQRYRRDRLALVFHAHPEAKYLSDGIRFVSKGPPDFVGFTYPDGRGVIFDAKETAKSSFPFRSLAPHQARDLEAGFLCGARSFLLLHYTRARRYAVLPWALLRDDWWRWHEEGGRPASIPKDDGRHLLVSKGDWIEVLESIPCAEVEDLALPLAA